MTTNTPGKGEMIVEILEDGTIKVTTGDMAGAIHQTAEEFMADMRRLLGGEVTTEKTKQSHSHHHHHGHGHNHAGGGHSHSH